MSVIRCMGCMKEYEDSFDICPYCGYAKDTKNREDYLEQGTILRNKYIVGKVLGNSDNEVTYLGWDAVLESKVVIKEYYPANLSTRINGEKRVITYDGNRKIKYDNGLNSFINAGNNLASFNYIDNIVHFFDSFSENNTGYIVMEYLEGTRLSDVIELQGKKSYEETMSIFIPVLNALAILHNSGIIHGDISPQNILITKNNKIKLIDFNLELHSRINDKKSTFTKGYSAVELSHGNGKLGPWSDIYSISATMYFTLTGRPPVDSLQRLENDTLTEIKKHAPSIPVNVANAIMNALNIKPQDRVNSVEQFIAMLSGKQNVKRIKNNNKKGSSVKVKVIAVVAVLLCCVAVGVVAFIITQNSNGIKSDISGTKTVINLYGKTVDEANRELKKINKSVDVKGSLYDDGSLLEELDVNTIVKSAEIVDKKDTVKVIVYGGKKASTKADINNNVTVPNLYGMKKDKAIKTLGEYGLKYTVEKKVNDNFVNTVYWQSPGSGTKVQVGTEIAITVGQDSKVETTKSTTAVNSNTSQNTQSYYQPTTAYVPPATTPTKSATTSTKPVTTTPKNNNSTKSKVDDADGFFGS